MKQTLTFNLSTIASTESKIKVDYFDTSVEAFDNGEYLQSFYALLDYVNDEFREKYGNAKGTEFNIPHGSIVVNIKIENDWLLIHAPFLSLPEKNRIACVPQPWPPMPTASSASCPRGTKRPSESAACVFPAARNSA